MQNFTARAEALDAADPLAKLRDRFVPIEPGLIYLDGNSLGRTPKAAVEVARNAIERQWGDRLIRSWGEGWYDLPQRLGAKIAQLIGAQPDEILIADSTSVNFFKLGIAALQARPDRQVIVSDEMNFPSDLYLLQGCVHLLAERKIRLAESADGIHLPPDSIEENLDRNVALLTLSHTSFKSGFVHDMKRLTAAAHDAGALTLWDLSHSVGAVPVDLNGCNADLAVGCCYKYVNGGPGAPAFLYVRRDLQEELMSPIWGWFGQRQPFEFSMQYTPAAGMAKFLAGTPPVLSMAMIEPGVDLLLEAGMGAVREKSLKQTEFLIEMIDARLAPLGVELSSPRDPARRGSHIAIRHPEALRIDLALIREMNVIPDFRMPDNIRLGVAPLYTNYAELAEAVERVATVIEERRYERYSASGQAVT